MVLSKQNVRGKTFEEYGIDEKYTLILYQSENDPSFFAFGTENDLHDRYGFPVNQCGTQEEVEQEIERWIKGDFTGKEEKQALKGFLNLLNSKFESEVII